MTSYVVYSKIPEDKNYCLGRASSLENLVELVIDLNNEDGYRSWEMEVIEEEE